MRLPRCLLLLCAILLSLADIAAQPCRPIRANRGKTLGWNNSYRILTTTTRMPDGHYRIVRDLERDTTRVQVFKDEALFQQFDLLRGAIAQSYMVYEQHGEVLIDSLNPGRPGRSRVYKPAYAFTRHVYATLNPAAGSLVYYGTSGFDSLRLSYYPGGALREEVICSAILGGADSAAREWTAQGILISRRTRGDTSTYYPDGVLRRRALDTVIARPVKCRRDYDPTGILRTVQYLADDTPVHTWRFYRDDGSLLRTQQFRRPGSIPYNEGMMMVEAPPYDEIYTLIDQQPRPPEDLTPYIRDGLARALCASRQPLSGRYAVTMDVDEVGKTTYHSVAGLNAAGLEPSLWQFFAEMPRNWVPHRENGSPAAVRMVLELEVR